MLTLSRPRRQVLASLAILAGMVAPTAYIGWTAWKVNQPGHRHQVEHEVSRLLGVEFTARAVDYPRPSVVVYRGVVINEAELRPKQEQRQELARADRLRFLEDGRQLTIEADGLRLQGSSPRQALAQVAAFLPRASLAEFEQLNLIAPTCELRLGPDLAPFALRELAGSLRMERGEPKMTASFRVAGEGASPRCELTWSRGRPTPRAETVLALKTTDGQPLSARVLDLFFASAEWLGPAARVQGELTLRQAGTTEWRAEFQGALLDVDMGTLLARVAPQHPLNSRARIDVKSARWEDQPGRGPGWVEAHGSLRGGGGTIGSGLLSSLQTQLGFRIGDRINLTRPELEFQALGLDFDLERSGEIRFRGGLGPDYMPGSVLVQGQRFTPLATAPEGMATVTALIRTLAPAIADRPDLVIPANFESLMIQRYLPTPPKNDVQRAIGAN